MPELGLKFNKKTPAPKRGRESLKELFRNKSLLRFASRSNYGYEGAIVTFLAELYDSVS